MKICLWPVSDLEGFSKALRRTSIGKWRRYLSLAVSFCGSGQNAELNVVWKFLEALEVVQAQEE